MRWKSTETPTFAGSAGSNGEPAVVETMELLDREDTVVGAFTKDVAGNIGFNAPSTTVASTTDRLALTGLAVGARVYQSDTGFWYELRTAIAPSVEASWQGLPKIYRALLTQSGAGTDTATSGTLTVGFRYKITDFNTGDDFTNVGAASNATNVEFIATGTTPAVWSNSSELTDTATPVATVLENTLGGTLVWTRAVPPSVGIYRVTLEGAFTANKVVCTLGSLVPPSEYVIGQLIRLDADRLELTNISIEGGVFALADGCLSNTAVTVLVYP